LARSSASVRFDRHNMLAWFHTLCLPRVGAQRGADPGNLVRRDADTGAGPAEEHTLIAVAACDSFGGHFRGQRPCRLRACGYGPEGDDWVAVFLEPVAHGGMHRIGLVGAEGDTHPTSVDSRRSVADTL
jgi:hypothetical protein